ncbi:MAG: aminoacetone oxidase family FAD-binding enzyme, partial [Planctomycetota bacterium]
MTDWDIAIIGAGAAGLAAGIFALEADPSLRVGLFDGARKVGAKILVAGGGRCNVTHYQTIAKDYNAKQAGFVKNVLKSFTADDTVAWMKSLGVELKREPTGKMFPTTDKARTVLQALLDRLDELGGQLYTEHRVKDVRGEEGGFVVDTYSGTHRARRVVLCTGGKSLPRSGSDGAGYGIVRSLGHTVTETHPALVSMTLQQHFPHKELAGVSHDAQLTTLVEGKPIDRRVGSLLWTHFGLTGPVVMDASRHWLAARLAGRMATWRMSLLPGERLETLEPQLLSVAKQTPTATVRKLLEQFTPVGASMRQSLPAKVLEVALRQAGVAGETKLSQWSKADRRAVLNLLLDWPLPVEQDRGWNHAEVTAGGVPLSEVAWRGMASRSCGGLHLAGEILDVDGRIGGFNFQWAWATGKLAGEA